jgi:hypothetical protein
MDLRAQDRAGEPAYPMLPKNKSSSGGLLPHLSLPYRGRKLEAHYLFGGSVKRILS